MHRDAAAATFFARIFYGVMHGFILLITFNYENDLKESCEASSLECYEFIVLKIVSIYLYFTVSSRQSFIEYGTEYPASEWEKPLPIYCEVCKMTQRYRSKHCKKCEKCISMYDHHCFWVGCCIGELNRFKFFCYLLIESLCIWWVFFSSFSGLIDGSEAYGAFVVNIGLTGIFGVLIGSLCTFHFYLISTCTTTWEFISRYKINYFTPYPSNFNPFSEGLLKNWKRAICSNKLTLWDLPQPLYVYPFNWCDNKYWSCC
jgi:palmitoyltransferase